MEIGYVNHPCSNKSGLSPYNVHVESMEARMWRANSWRVLGRGMLVYALRLSSAFPPPLAHVSTPGYLSDLPFSKLCGRDSRRAEALANIGDTNPRDSLYYAAHSVDHIARFISRKTNNCDSTLHERMTQYARGPPRILTRLPRKSDGIHIEVVRMC